MNLNPDIKFLQNEGGAWESYYLLGDGRNIEPLVLDNRDATLLALAEINVHTKHVAVVNAKFVASSRPGFIVRVAFDNEADEAEFIMKVSDRSNWDGE